MKGGGSTRWKIVWFLTLAPFVFQFVPFTVSGLPQTPKSASTSSCLKGDGPFITLSGVKMSQYWDTSLADDTRIDASTAQFLTSSWAPVRLGGGSNICFHGGELIGQLPPSTSWSTNT